MISEDWYAVVSPEGRPVPKKRISTSKVDDMSRAVVAQVWDYRFRGDEVFAALRELLSQRYPGIEFVDYDRFGDIHGPNADELVEALPGRLRESGCTAVVAGMGA